MPADTQMEFGVASSEFRSDPKDWYALHHFLEEIEEEMQQQRQALLMRVATWMVAHNVFRKVESRRMVLCDPGLRDLEYHDALASMLMGCGKMLLLELRHRQEVNLTELGFEFEDLTATVSAVERDWKSWHFVASPERNQQILNDVFGE